MYSSQSAVSRSLQGCQHTLGSLKLLESLSCRCWSMHTSRCPPPGSVVAALAASNTMQFALPKAPARTMKLIAASITMWRLQVPVHQHILTEVHLFATAGFRVLAPRPAADLINSCRDLLAASRFKFRDEWASVMSGGPLHACSQLTTLHSLAAPTCTTFHSKFTWQTTSVSQTFCHPGSCT